MGGGWKVRQAQAQAQARAESDSPHNSLAMCGPKITCNLAASAVQPTRSGSRSEPRGSSAR
jgi:hypothetical protein